MEEEKTRMVPQIYTSGNLASVKLGGLEVMERLGESSDQGAFRS